MGRGTVEILNDLRDYFFGIEYYIEDEKKPNSVLGLLVGRRGNADIILVAAMVPPKIDESKLHWKYGEKTLKARSFESQQEKDIKLFLLYEKEKELDILTNDFTFILPKIDPTNINTEYYVSIFLLTENSIGAKLISRNESNQTMDRNSSLEPFMEYRFNELGEWRAWHYGGGSGTIKVPTKKWIEDNLRNLSPFQEEYAQLSKLLQEGNFLKDERIEYKGETVKHEYIFLLIMERYNKYCNNKTPNDFKQIQDITFDISHLNIVNEDNFRDVLLFIILCMKDNNRHPYFFSLNKVLKQSLNNVREVCLHIYTLLCKKSDTMIKHIVDKIGMFNDLNKENTENTITKITTYYNIETIIKHSKASDSEAVKTRKNASKYVNFGENEPEDACLNTLRIAACFTYLWLKGDSFNDSDLWF